MATNLPEYVRHNRAAWEVMAADVQVPSSLRRDVRRGTMRMPEERCQHVAIFPERRMVLGLEPSPD